MPTPHLACTTAWLADWLSIFDRLQEAIALYEIVRDVSGAPVELVLLERSIRRRSSPVWLGNS
ncbi:MAG: hypothetical protein QM784_14615 [Polyangiaceae bacterium]